MAKAKTVKGVSCVTRKGVEYWYARVDGKKAYCGKGDEGRKMAEAAKAKDVAKQYEHREVRAGLKVHREEFKTVRELCNWYMAIPAIQEQRAYYRKITASANLLRLLGNKPISGIEGDEQERYRQIRQGEGAAAATVNIEIALLSAMYHQARKWKKISAESMPGQFVLRHDMNPRRLIRDEEYQALLDHADEGFRDVLFCAWESAMRSTEIANLRAGQVHLDEDRISGGKRMVVDYINLGIFDSKNKTERTVPVSPTLKEVLERHIEGLAPDDRVFLNRLGKPWSNGTIAQSFRLLCEKVNITWGDKAKNAKGERIGIVFHCLRHTRTSKWVEMGFSDEIIRRATGHLNLEAYRTYVKLDPSVVMRLVSQTDNSGTKTLKSRDSQGL